MHSLALGAGHLGQKGADRALPVGAGDMDGWREVVLRRAKRCQEPLKAAQGEVNFLGMQACKARQRVVEGLSTRANVFPRRSPHGRLAAVPGRQEWTCPASSS